MQNFLIFVIGFIVGVGIVALLSANKPDDIEHEKTQKYKQGYEKGFKDGCDNQRAYIKELEKHLGLLQKTLDVANKNKVLVRKVRVSGRKKNVCKNHYR